MCMSKITSSTASRENCGLSSALLSDTYYLRNIYKCTMRKSVVGVHVWDIVPRLRACAISSVHTVWDRKANCKFTKRNYRRDETRRGRALPLARKPLETGTSSTTTLYGGSRYRKWMDGVMSFILVVQ
ncbi:hypothetical protein XENOCAPTIV_030520 [Xenoophorus captivus]|uniref:Uncharacterized protein n=1 Tax=Xenoophorus captivus TaxID=1517983 RepID=A0ABV0S5E5_9TELE